MKYSSRINQECKQPKYLLLQRSAGNHYAVPDATTIRHLHTEHSGRILSTAP
jgi:hypothetical protein